MKKYEVNVLWTMIVPTYFSSVIYANSEEEAMMMAKKAADSNAFEEWEKHNATNENIYFEEYSEITVKKVN